MIKVNLSRGDNPIDHIKESLKIISEIDKCFNKREKIQLDLSDIPWVLPCSVILISGKLREVSNAGAEVSYIPPKNKKVEEWLMSIGFPLGKTPDGGTFVSLKYFPNNPYSSDQVNKEANALMDSMEKKIPNNFGEGVRYILGELADNIDEHSNFSFAALISQFYPTKEHLDLAVLDNGITIPFNFEKNNLKFKNDSEAIMKAISGEITTKQNEIMRGFGLKSCRDISTKGIGGELYILSRKGLVIIKDNEEPSLHELGDLSLKGTFLYFRLPTPKEKLNIGQYL